MKEFEHWSYAIQEATIPEALMTIKEALTFFQDQTGLFGDKEKILTNAHLFTLRKQ